MVTLLLAEDVSLATEVVEVLYLEAVDMRLRL